MLDASAPSSLDVPLDGTDWQVEHDGCHAPSLARDDDQTQRSRAVSFRPRIDSLRTLRIDEYAIRHFFRSTCHLGKSMSDPSSNSDGTNTFPAATIKSISKVSAEFRSRLWWLTLLCVLISLGLFWAAYQGKGEIIIIDFSDSFGLKPEDRLKFHGVEIGAVEKIELNGLRDGVSVHVRLTPQARSMAAEGARFWIVRPVLSLDSIQGLDTILGAKYLAIDPAPSGAKPASRFQGLDTPPIVTPPEGSLEITLDANTRGGLENNAPILYRGFRIGSVVQVGFATDARTVQARCAIAPEYRDLVRRNSKFWNRSGWRLDVGLTGIKLDADTLSQMITGGIEVATPTDADRNVSTGHRFKLYDKAEPEWSNWQPSLAHGEAWHRIALKMPQPIRLAVRWQERSFGFRKNQQRLGWCLPLDDGRILCLQEQIAAPASAIADSLLVELAGLSLPASKLTIPTSVPAVTGGTRPATASRFSIADSLPAEVTRWTVGLLGAKLPSEVCDVFLAHPDAANVLAIDAARITIQESGWQIDDLLMIDRDYHGIPVVSAATSQVIGLLNIAKNGRFIVILE